MCCQLFVDTSVISPVGPVGSGVGSGAPPMTLHQPPTTTTTEVPNHLTQDTTLSRASSPVADSGLPAVQVMFDQLKGSHVLLSDIDLKPQADTSPLAHLQPQQLATTGGVPVQPAVSTLPQPTAIQLASTAPTFQKPNANSTPVYDEPTKPHGFVYGIIVGLTTVILLVGGMFAYQYIVFGLETGDSTNPIIQSYDAVLDSLPFINHENTDTIPEAAWYQEQ